MRETKAQRKHGKKRIHHFAKNSVKNFLPFSRKKSYLTRFERFLINMFVALSYFLLILIFLLFLISQIYRLQNIMKYFIVDYGVSRSHVSDNIKIV